MDLADRIGPIRKVGGAMGPSGGGVGGGGSGTPTVPAEVTVDPSADAVVAGQTATFAVTAVGAPAPTYQWQVNDGGGWVNVSTGSGRTSASYTTAALVIGDDGNLYRCKVSNGEDDLSEPALLAVEAAVAAQITVGPSNDSVLDGATASFSITAIGTPAPTYQWQVNDGGGWVNVSTGTGGTTNSYTTAALVIGDDGNLYRCTATNGGGSATSTSASVEVTSAAQDSARFLGDTAGAGVVLGASLGGAGLTAFTIAGWFYIESTAEYGQVLVAKGQANREAGIQCDTTFGVFDVSFGDSNTGLTVDIWGANTPPLNQWIFMTMRGPAAWPGVFTLTWQAEGGGTIYTATRANGMEGSIEISDVVVNYGGAGYGLNMRAQYVRGYGSRLADGVLDAERTKTDPTGSFFWGVFENNGGGGVQARDASGNARVFTLTNATLAAGPAVGAVP